MTTDREALVALDPQDVRTAYAYMKERNFPDIAACRVIQQAYAALTAQGGEQTDTVSVPRDLLHCTLLLFRGALDCKDWIWSPDQWEAGDTWCKELQAMLAAAKEGK